MTEPFREIGNPRVSVIVPAFNAARTIRDAVASVFAQTYRDFEVIVVDDGSTDGTCAALEAWRDRVSYVAQPNGGPGRARNTGIGRARGEFVAFLDADDLWLPHKLERQIEYFDAFPDAGLVHTAVCLGMADAGALARATAAVAHTPPRRIYCELFETRTEIHTLSVMVRRAVLDEVGGFDERREIHVEDWDLWLRIAECYRDVIGLAPLSKEHLEHAGRRT
jgi:glycosyltransferase involved in cell wall biosynthesis